MESTVSVTPFESLVALRAAHTDLLRKWQEFEDDSRLPEDFLNTVKLFLQRGESTGALLDIDEERADAQTLLNYWTTVLYGAGVAHSAVILRPFDEAAAVERAGPESPYRGLEPFEENEASLFFGRHRLVRQVTNWLADHRFIVILGLSGTGKSSLLRAGVIPALRDGAISGSDSWRYLTPIVPGTDPLLALARVTRPDDVSLDVWRRRLSQDSGAVVAHWRTDTEPTLLTIDQFEELFTLVVAGDERAQFMAILDRIATDREGPPHRVMLAMRSDFESFLMKYPAIQQLAPDKAIVRLAPLDPLGLRHAIEKPAARRGVVFEAGLVEELIQQVIGEPAGLPLLQFALFKLWEQRDGRTITWNAYKSLGGSVREILTRAADKTYDSFTLHEDRAIVEAIFQRLVHMEGGEVTSRRLTRSELSDLPFAAERLDRVLTALESAGLLRISDEVEQERRIEITHEALIRNWARLETWIGDVKERRRKRAQLTAAVDWWYAHDRHPSGLLRGVRLAEAEEYSDLDERERAFVKASRRAAESQRNRTLVTALTTLSVVVVLLGLWIFASRQAASALLERDRIEQQTADARTRYTLVQEDLAKIVAEVERQRNELQLARDAADKLALEKLEAERNYQQSQAQLEVVETEVKELFDVRPAIPVQDGKLVELPREWRNNLEQHSGDIARSSPGVGLLEWPGGRSMSTAFVVAPGIIAAFAGPDAPPTGSVVDFSETPTRESPLRFDVTEVIGADRALGIALLRVQTVSSKGRPLPRPLSLGRGKTLAPGSPVYVIGYPQQLDASGPRQVLQSTRKSARPDGKRVQPGYLLSVAPKGARYTHDCFTAPGNAGSPVIELETGRVIGFHIGGQPATAKGPGIKEAIGFWALVDHPLIAKAGIKVE